MTLNKIMFVRCLIDIGDGIEKFCLIMLSCIYADRGLRVLVIINKQQYCFDNGSMKTYQCVVQIIIINQSNILVICFPA